MFHSRQMRMLSTGFRQRFLSPRRRKTRFHPQTESSLEARVLLDAKFTWIDLDGGGWQVPGNWGVLAGKSTSGYPSTNGDAVIFEVENKAQTVFFSKSESVGLVLVQEGQPTLDLNGHTLTIAGFPSGLFLTGDRYPETPRMGVDVPSLTIIDGKVVVPAVQLGGGVGQARVDNSRPPTADDATLIVGEGGTLQVGALGMTVGFARNGVTWGSGIVRISGGGKILHTDSNVDVVGSVTVTGLKSEWSDAGISFTQGGGSLTVENGAIFRGSVFGSSGGTNIMDTVIVQGNSQFHGSQISSGSNGLRFLAYKSATVESIFTSIGRANTAVPKPVFLVEDSGTVWNNQFNVLIGGGNGANTTAGKYGGILGVNKDATANIQGTLTVGFEGEVYLLSGKLLVGGVELQSGSKFDWESGQLTIRGGTVTGNATGFWQNSITLGNNKKLTLENKASLSRSLVSIDAGSALEIKSGSTFNAAASKVLLNGTLLLEDGTFSASALTMADGDVEGRGTINAPLRFDGPTSTSLVPRAGALQTLSIDLHDKTVFFSPVQGSNPGQFGQVQVTGTVQLDDAELRFNASSGFRPGPAQELILIDNDGTDPVTGRFRVRVGAQLVQVGEGATFPMSDRTWRITYRGGDGNDVAITEVLPENVVLRNGTTGRFIVGNSSGTTFGEALGPLWSPSAGWDIFNGDFNGDGLMDVAGRTSSGAWYVALANGTSMTSTYFGSWGANSQQQWTDVMVGDFTGDGKDDIVGRNWRGEWYVARSTGTSFVTQLWGKIAQTGWEAHLVGDFNGDGRDDIASFHRDGNWWVSESTGTGFALDNYGRVTDQATANWRNFLVGDFNGDGIDDVIQQHSTGNWFIGDGGPAVDGRFTMHFANRWDPNAFHDFHVGDFNGDGRQEIAARTLTNVWWVNRSLPNGRMNSENWGAWNPALTWGAVIGDFNGDGRDDIAGFVPATGAWWVLLSQGNKFANSPFGRWTGLTGPYYIAGRDDYQSL